jgi:hypothetical protein
MQIEILTLTNILNTVAHFNKRWFNIKRKQFTYNITLIRVRLTIGAVEKQ